MLRQFRGRRLKNETPVVQKMFNSDCIDYLEKFMTLERAQELQNLKLIPQSP